MAQEKQVGLSATQKSEIGSRWKAGESLHEIGRAFGKGHSSIRFLLLQRGGIVPAARRRSLLALTLAERGDISRGLACGSSIRNNTNRLLRQYLPKRTDLSGYAQSELDKIALRLNQRPRKTLGFQTPASRLRATVASTG